MRKHDALVALVNGINDVCGYSYGTEEIDPSRPITDFGVDSLNVMQVLAAVEAHLDIRVDQGRLTERDFVSVGTLADYLVRCAEDGQ
ncbi:MAG: acyl carrier protein [Solirubrobacterales bacterium]